MTEIRHVFFTNDIMHAARIADNAREHGAEEVRITQVKGRDDLWRVEYKTREEENT